MLKTLRRFVPLSLVIGISIPRSPAHTPGHPTSSALRAGARRSPPARPPHRPLPPGFHIYEVTRDGRHALYRWFGNQWQTLLSPQPSPALRIGEQPNHLLLVRESGLTRLFANGQEVSLVTDIAAPAGRSGVYASTNAGGLEARFDNYRLYAPPERPGIYRLYGG